MTHEGMQEAATIEKKIDIVRCERQRFVVVRKRLVSTAQFVQREPVIGQRRDRRRVGLEPRSGVANRCNGPAGAHHPEEMQSVKLIAFAGAVGPGFRDIHQGAPVIGSRAGSRVELIDPVVLTFLFRSHRSLPLACVGGRSVGAAPVMES